ncbi:MAG: hypothetical protein Q4A11_00750 [Brachymonas sp.]|nr:hypothetical protein [Brachymonas sp.]
MKPLAPAPVHYRLAPGRGLFLALAVLLLALGSVLLAWLLALRQAQQTGAVLWMAVAMAYGAACVGSWRTAQALPSGWLVWNGKLWQLQEVQTPLQPEPISAMQAGQASSLHAPSVDGTAIESSGLEAASAQPAMSYTTCTLVLDLQRGVLLRLHGQVEQGTEQGAESPAPRSRWAGKFSSTDKTAASAVWVWANRASDPVHWHALRCALVWAQMQTG